MLHGTPISMFAIANMKLRSFRCCVAKFVIYIALARTLTPPDMHLALAEHLIKKLINLAQFSN